MATTRDHVEHVIWRMMPAPKVRDIAEAVAHVDAVLTAVDEYMLEVTASPVKRGRALRAIERVAP